MTSIVLSRIEVRNANAQPAWWIVGPPSPTAYCGFAHALARALDCTEELIGVMPVHHSYELLAEGGNYKPAPHQFRAATFIDHNDHVGASGIKYGPLSAQPTARCNLTITLVIQFEPDTIINPKEITRFLATARFAGGTFYEIPTPVLKNSIDDVWFGGNSFGIHERLDLMTDEPLDLIDLCHPDNRENSWLMPTTLGYQTITKPEHKTLARSNCLHAFAEPLVGPVQYVSVRESLPPVWRQTANAEGTCIVTTQPISIALEGSI